MDREMQTGLCKIEIMCISSSCFAGPELKSAIPHSYEGI